MKWVISILCLYAAQRTSLEPLPRPGRSMPSKQEDSHTKEFSDGGPALREEFEQIVDATFAYAGKLFLYRAKTGLPVRVRLPADVVQLLREVPTMNPNFFFWSGNGDPENREERMATGTSSAVQVGESQETRWQPETLPPAHVPRHVRRGIAALGSSN